ncbi:beta-1 adrenergic receptor-like [Clytia hemisphaerica]|uniref:G-protein coupled receptors family 1 profile domain-containing protein n=1 Tax=Clytia hemisphaerica TaxID=252671 RepID=A0A7M5XCF7_9CNID|eukprot:TCONS_00048285-protein
MVFGNGTAIRDLKCPATLVYVDSQAFTINSIVVAIFNLVVAVPTIMLNILVIVAMSRKASLRKLSNKILTNLAISDLLSGLMVQPSISAILIIANSQTPLDVPCQLVIFTSVAGYTLACVSLLTVSFVSFERYVAIFYPFFYNRRISSRLLLIVCASIWIVSFVAIFSMYFTNQHALFFWTNLVVITFTYLWNIYVYIQIMRQVNKIHRDMQQRLKVLGTEKNVKNNSKSMRLAAVVILNLLSCYLPQIILSIWRSIPSYPLFVDGYLEYWSMTIGPFASCLNPLVYCYYDPEIKREVCSIVTRSRRKQDDFSRSYYGGSFESSPLPSSRNFTIKERMQVKNSSQNGGFCDDQDDPVRKSSKNDIEEDNL